ncbi:MAG: hypothetical protein A3E61_02305 [Candidatus Colwellbacteria bacterium RIFCSPHIGHO2_12_FULL_43_12]|uniref:Type II secretion system protein GspG C-terminal domain-containing protein n=3 Tax=Candidatus Colwelliibacteriota TaxID=1817904 RepID=A0A1G1Z0A8_9BACT|nr:MAG: hypothetical protein A3D47_02075 [Candidatus Colwellbacteria bacterium RIFCSPHIGHO2_02_FULL_43_15]OGY58918.1 MAG: hypothetical protein A3E61_02305 [Candidatus Colwellbacteria bacterium RIFCSPHIGHO2_12_FULL_43_12]OGY61832.1 MAG: hypothetical protein A3F99_02180 [Candidatus Colwellbacteria bacterium RIFCSPLOWO2_12_FULL_43_11]
MTKKGFTLIELLIVIGILAILASATVLILNPAQILQESRDTQRLNDLGTINSAIALYLATNTTPTFTTAWRCTLSPVAAPCAGAIANQIRLLDGTGWVAINLGTTSGLSTLPMDPNGTQTAALHYSASTNDAAKTWELTAQMESVRYSNTGGADKESTDGGSSADCYEVGTNLVLIAGAGC